MRILLFFHNNMINSSAAGDWVNCGICGEWAHFGCDRRQGLGAFKVMASLDESCCVFSGINVVGVDYFNLGI